MRYVALLCFTLFACGEPSAPVADLPRVRQLPPQADVLLPDAGSDVLVMDDALTLDVTPAPDPEQPDLTPTLDTQPDVPSAVDVPDITPAPDTEQPDLTPALDTQPDVTLPDAGPDVQPDAQLEPTCPSTADVLCEAHPIPSTPAIENGPVDLAEGGGPAPAGSWDLVNMRVDSTPNLPGHAGGQIVFSGVVFPNASSSCGTYSLTLLVTSQMYGLNWRRSGGAAYTAYSSGPISRTDACDTTRVPIEVVGYSRYDGKLYISGYVTISSFGRFRTRLTFVPTP